jgi:hypothetical protein
MHQAMSGLGVAIVDANLRFITVSSALAMMNGVPSAQHCGKRVRDILGSAARNVEPQFESIFAGGCSVLTFEFTAQLRHREGPARWILQYFPIRDAAGNVKATAAFVVEMNGETDIEKVPVNDRHIALRTEVWDCLGRSEREIRERARELTGPSETPPNYPKKGTLGSPISSRFCQDYSLRNSQNIRAAISSGEGIRCAQFLSL